MYIIAGLGNPGREYEKTRHNAGFEVLDRLAAKLEVSNWEKKHKALAGKAMYAGEKLLLLKPQTYMNLSGESLLSAAAFYRVTPDHILVIPDSEERQCRRAQRAEVDYLEPGLRRFYPRPRRRGQ